MRVSTKRILSIFIAFLFFIGALVVYFNLVQTEGTAVNKLRASLLSKQNLLSAQKQVVGQVENLIAQFQDVGTVRDAVALAIPNGEHNVDALRQIESIARNSGVSLVSIDFKAAVARTATKKDTVSASDLLKKLGTLKINVTASGQYSNLKQFLAMLETTARIANTQSFEYTPGSGQDTQDRLSAEVEMYYQQ
jgi:Tfp pilus assembly protein PilO